jgi:ubiquinone/menaquinone biosynthesis C-methylase UbiE
MTETGSGSSRHDPKYEGTSFTPDYAADVIKGYAGYWERGRRTWKVDRSRRSRLDWLIRQLNLQGREVILEIGCGFGPLVYRCLKTAPECRCLGMDLSWERLMPAVDYFNQLGLESRILFGLADGKRLPLGDGSVHRILLIDVLEHMSDADKRAILEEAFRVLAVGGSLLINTPNLDYLLLRVRAKRILYKLLFKDASKVDIPHTPGSSVEGDHIGLTRTGALREMLRASGFEKVGFLSKADNIYGVFLSLLCGWLPGFRERFAQSITLRCFKTAKG